MHMLEQPESFEPLDGSFLYQDVIETTGFDQNRQFWRETGHFWITYKDLFAGDGYMPGVVLQYAKDSIEQIVALDDNDRATGSRTLIFQALSPATYAWKLVKTDENGRTEISTQTRLNQASSVRYDTQGCRTAGVDLDIDRTADVLREIQAVMRSGIAIESLDGLRKRREEMAAAIGDFVVDGVLRYSPNKFQSLLDKKQKTLEGMFLTQFSTTI